MVHYYPWPVNIKGGVVGYDFDGNVYMITDGGLYIQGNGSLNLASAGAVNLNGASLNLTGSTITGLAAGSINFTGANINLGATGNLTMTGGNISLTGGNILLASSAGIQMTTGSTNYPFGGNIAVPSVLWGESVSGDGFYISTRGPDMDFPTVHKQWLLRDVVNGVTPLIYDATDQVTKIVGGLTVGGNNVLTTASTLPAHTHAGGDVTSAVGDSTKWNNKSMPSNSHGVLHNDGAGALSWASEYTPAPTPISGSASLTDSVSAGSDFTKTVSLGASFSMGRVVFRGGSAGQGMIANISTTESQGFSNMYTGWGSAIYLQGEDSKLSQALSAVTGNANIYVKSAYLNSSNLNIVFHNNDTGSQSLACTIYYHAW